MAVPKAGPCHILGHLQSFLGNWRGFFATALQFHFLLCPVLLRSLLRRQCSWEHLPKKFLDANLKVLVSQETQSKGLASEVLLGSRATVRFWRCREPGHWRQVKHSQSRARWSSGTANLPPWWTGTGHWWAQYHGHLRDTREAATTRSLESDGCFWVQSMGLRKRGWEWLITNLSELWKSDTFPGITERDTSPVSKAQKRLRFRPKTLTGEWDHQTWETSGQCAQKVKSSASP